MTTNKVFRSVIFSAVSRKFQAAAFLILLMAGGRLLSAQALLQAGIASVTGTSPDLTLDLKMTNAGNFTALRVSLRAVTFKVLSGDGSVSLTSPTLPTPPADILAGSSTDVHLNVHLTGSVQRFSVTEGVTLANGPSVKYVFTATQTVDLASPTKTLSFTPTSLTYAAQTDGTTSAAQSVTVNSIGTASVALSNIQLTGANAADYAVSANTCGPTLASGANCAVSITFTPSAIGTRTAALTFTDDASGSPQAVPITGTGQTKTLSFSPVSLTYPAQTDGTTSAAQSVTVNSVGSASVALSNIQLTGANAADYAISINTCGPTLASGANCSVSITFTPSATGTRTAALTFTDDASGSPQAVPITGTGQTKTLSFSPTSLTYAAQTDGTTSVAQSVTVNSTGTATVALATIHLTGANAADYAVSANTCGPTLASGANCSVSITFTPSATGTRTAALTFTDDAFGSPQAVPITGTGQTKTLSFSPTSLTYTIQTVGTTSAAQSVTIASIGTATVNLSSLQLTGANAAEYAITTNTCGLTLASGANCSVSITFTPAGAGTRTAALTLTDDASGSPQAVPITGTGQATTKSLSFNPPSLTYAAQTDGTTSGAQSITITSIGTATVNLSNIQLTGANAADYAISANTCGPTLAPTATCSVSITFTPSATGTRAAALTFTDDASGSPQSVGITGTGQTKTLSFSPTSLTYAAQTDGTTSAAQSVTINSVGTATVNLSNIQLTGANAADYAISANTCGPTLASGANCSVSITFTPSATGTRTAALTLTDDASGSPQSVGITGIGQTKTLSFSPTSLTYTIQTVGTTSAAQSVTVNSIGTATVNLSTIQLTGTNAADYSITTNTCGLTLASGANCSVSITFTPSATGTRTAALTLTDDAPTSPQSVPITGTGQTKTLSFSPTSLTYTTQNVGTTSAAQSVTITSVGTATVNLSTIQLTGANAADYAISINTCGLTLASAANCSVSITFNPSVAGTRTAALTLTDDASGSPQSVAITGTGQASTKSLGFSPTSLTYAAQNVGTTSAAQSVMVTSTGTATVNLSTIQLTGANATDYSITTNTCGLTLASGANCSVFITFTPTATGTRTAALTFTDDASGSPQSVGITGIGQTKTLSLSPTSLTYTIQTVGTTSAAQSVTVTNSGTATVSLFTTVLTGANSADYAISANTCSSTLASGANCSISITFSPSAVGARTAALTLTDDATGSPQSVPITGTGQTKILTFSPTSLTYTAQTVGTTSAAQSVTITSTGTATVNLTNSQLTGGGAADYAISANTCGPTLASGANCSVSITFSPSTTGIRNANLTLTDDAPASPQSVPITGTGQSKTLSFSPTSLTYAAQNLGSTSAPKSVTISSIGTATVGITNIQLTGTNAADYTISANTCGPTLASGTNCAVSITFSPSAIGASTAALTLTDDASGSPQSVLITGSGQPASKTLGLSPTSLTYAGQGTGTTSAAQSVTVSSTGTATITFSSILLTGANAADYAISANTCGSTLASGANCSISITFTPSVAGTRAAALTFTDDATGSPQSVTLTGTGQPPSQILVFTPTSLTLNPAIVGANSSNNLTVLSAGASTVTFTGAAITGTNAADFSVTANNCASLTPGGTCIITVKFTPSATGLRTASLQVTDSAPSSPQTVPLSAVGETAIEILTPSTPAITFSQQNVGTTSSASFVQFTNNGTAPVNFTSVTVTSGVEFSITSNSCTGSLATGSTCTVNVTFTPSAIGNRSSSLSIVDDAPGSPQTIALVGIGVTITKTLSLTPTALAFPGQNVLTTSGVEVVQFTNIGTGAVTFTAPSITGNFAISTNNCTGALAAGGSCTVNVTFTPSAPGSETGTLTVNDDALSSPQTVSLLGSGVAIVKSLTFSPGTLTFAQNVGTTSSGQAVTIFNAGTATVNISSAAITGTDQSEYSIGSTNCSATLPSTGSCSYTINFTPTATGIRPAAFTITDDATGSPQSVSLDGVGLTVSQALAFSPLNLSFGVQVDGFTTASAEVIVSNTGDAPVTFTAYSITGANPADFAIAINNCPLSPSPMAPLSSCGIFVTFTPSASGLRTATLQFTDSATGSPQTVALEGYGEDDVQTLSFNTAAIVFPAQPVTTTSATHFSTVTITGDAPVTFSAATVTGGNSGDFSVSSNGCTGPISPGLSCTGFVVFTPSTTGIRQSTLQFTDNATGSPQSIVLVGNGTSGSAALTFNPTDVDFGNLISGTTSGLTQVNVTNSTGSSLTFSSITTTGANAADFSIDGSSTCAATLAAGATCKIFVALTPSGLGIRIASLQFVHTGVGSPQIVGLFGTGIASAKTLAFVPMALTAGPVNIGSSAVSSTTTVRNTGTATVTFTGITLTSPTDFSISTNSCTSPLAPGATCQLAATFTASLAAVESDSIRIASDATGSPQFINLSGFGQNSLKSIGAEPPSLAFGAQTIGTTSSSQNIRVTYTGTATVTFSAPTFTGTNAADFAVFSGCTTLSNGACGINITFTPTVAGVETATLNINSDAAGSPLQINLTGIGQTLVKSLSTSTPALVYAAQNIGTTSLQQNARVNTTGTATVTFSAPTFTGTNAADFAVSFNGCTTLTPSAGTCVVQVTFTPSVVGLETATLNLNSDAVGSPMQISLAGIGQTLVKSLITTTPALLFGAQNIGTTSLQQNARATITGTATVTFSAPNITGTNAADFAVSFNGCTTLTVGTCVVQVTFTPSFAGPETATLNINSDAVGSPMQINLAGIGQTLVKSLSTSTPALLFPAQNIGTTSTPQNARAIDTGNATVTFLAPTITGTNAADFAISFNSCTTLAPGAGGCNVQITFTPSLAGLETATLNLASDAIGSPIQISLTGVGQTVVKSVSVTPSLTYAAQNVGTDSGVQNVFVINTGTTLVTFSPFSITGANSGDFVIHANNCTGTLAPTVSCNVAIIFHPTATGSRTANLQVASDAVGSPQPVILTGTGQ